MVFPSIPSVYGESDFDVFLDNIEQFLFSFLNIYKNANLTKINANYMFRTEFVKIMNFDYIFCVVKRMQYFNYI